MTSRERLKGAAAALAVQGLLGWLLIAGLASSWRHVPESAQTVFQVAPPPPPPPREPRQPQTPRPRARPPGNPSLPGVRSTATDLVVPPPVIPPPAPPPVVAALVPSTGAQATSGAALVAGPGTGAGGAGTGTGGGGDGDGSPPRWKHGRIRDSDYPSAAALSGTSGVVGVRFHVDTQGRIDDCIVVGRSGSPELDATTCRLIRERFSYAPARDEHGRKVPAWLIETHEWVIDRPHAGSER